MDSSFILPVWREHGLWRFSMTITEVYRRPKVYGLAADVPAAELNSAGKANPPFSGGVKMETYTPKELAALFKEPPGRF